MLFSWYNEWMGIWKLKPHDWTSLKQPPKELTHFWKTYFSNLSIDFSKYYFRLTRDYVRVQMTHRQTLRAKDYFQDLCENEVIRPFLILPHGELGFLHIPNDMANYLIDKLLGANIQKNCTNYHELTTTDISLLEKVVIDKIKLVHSQFLDDSRGISIELIDENDVLLSANTLSSEQLISVQYFTYQVGDKSFVFTFALANRLLEQFILI